MAKDLKDNVLLTNALVKQNAADTNFRISGPGVDLTMDKISSSSEDWQIIQSEDYRPDKAKFVEEQWVKDFPQQPALTYDKICSLASRSRVITTWLAGVNVTYAASVAPPQWLQKEITPQEYQDAVGGLQQVTAAAADRAKEELQAAKEYKQKLKNIEDKFSSKLKTIKGNKNILKILTIQQTDLPITLQLAIENFTPSTKDDAPDQRMFAREMLTSYKISLIKYSKANPNVDIQTIIDQAAGL